MAAFKNIVFSLTLIFAINFLVTESTVTSTTKFDSYIGIIDKLTASADRLRVYQAVWGEIEANGANNLTQVKVYYDALQNRKVSTIAAEEEQAAELSELVREILIANNARLLAETFNNNKSQDVSQVAQFRERLFDDYGTNYNNNVLNAIFERAIDAVYPFKATDELYKQLDVIDQKMYYYLERNFHVRVNWTLYLYWKFLARGEINDQYVYNTARAFNNFRLNNLYKTLSRDTQRRIDLAFNTFTTSLKNLFNTTSICLENQNFANYYLNFPVSSIGSAASIQAVVKTSFLGYNSWANRFADPNQLAEADQFYLSYSQNGWLLYRRPTDLFVIVQRDSATPTNRYWTPTLRNDKIMFGNNGYYMCATSDFNNNLQGFNVKSVKITNMDDPLCLWKITDCSEIRV